MSSQSTTARPSPRLRVPVVVVPRGWSRNEAVQYILKTSGAMKKELPFKGLVNLLFGVAIGYWGKRFIEDRIDPRFIVHGSTSLYNYIIGINNWLAIYTSFLVTLVFLAALQFSRTIDLIVDDPM